VKPVRSSLINTNTDGLERDLPNALVAAGHLLLQRRSGGQSGQQAETEAVSEFSLQQESHEFGSVQIQRMWQD
jgi:hypothetical protein